MPTLFPYDPLVSPALEALQERAAVGRQITIALIDGPADRNHPALRGAGLRLAGEPPPGDFQTSTRHAIATASVIFGQPGSPVPGIAPACRGILIPAFHANGPGSDLKCGQVELARALSTAATEGANIINISGGQRDPSGAPHPLLAGAISSCARQGILIIAAAGNDGCRAVHIPAASPSVLAVGALDERGRLLPSTNWGYPGNALYGPGAQILAAAPGGGAARVSGSSYSTAIVSGIAALFMRIGPRDGDAVARALLAAAAAFPWDGDGQPVELKRLDLGATLDWLGISLGRQARATRSFPNTGGFLMEKDPLAMRPRPGLSLSDEEPAAEAAATEAPAKAASSSGCGCGCSKKPSASLVYALGSIGLDFGSEARRDSLLQQTGVPDLSPLPLLDYLDAHPYVAASVVWTLSLDQTPIYAIQPSGPFAVTGYERLREFLRAQLTEGVEMASVPGVTMGNTPLLSGHSVPVLFPEVRGMYSWTMQGLVAAAAAGGPEDEESRKQCTEAVCGFLERAYYELRNLGQTPPDRALNYAATNAFQLHSVFGHAIGEGLKLDSIDVERSPVCRAEADCWDVKLTLFNPVKRLEQARYVYRFTIDVSDVAPVTVGKVRHWHVY